MLNSCPAQRDFIRQSIAHNVRIDGRSNSTRRTPIIKTQVIAHLPGSSYVYLEYENIEIYTGIKIKIQQTTTLTENNLIALELSSMRKLSDEENDQMLLIQNIIQKRFIQKLAQSQEISEFLKISNSKKHKLMMYIDVFFLTSPHVSQIELILVGIRSALNSTTISEIEVSYNEVTEEEATELTKNTVTFKKDNWEDINIIGMVNQQNGEYFVLDMKREEYQSMDSCFLVTIFDNKVLHLQSLKGSISIDTINRCARFAITNAVPRK